MKDMEYKELLILAYFKDNNISHSIVDLKSRMGMSFFDIVKEIQEMMKKGLLYINDYKIVSLTLKGRVCLGKSKVENFKFLDDTMVEDEKKNEMKEEKFKINKCFFKAKWINKH